MENIETLITKLIITNTKEEEREKEKKNFFIEAAAVNGIKNPVKTVVAEIENMKPKKHQREKNKPSKLKPPKEYKENERDEEREQILTLAAAVKGIKKPGKTVVAKVRKTVQGTINNKVKNIREEKRKFTKKRKFTVKFKEFRKRV
jgi:hypothetical protein